MSNPFFTVIVPEHNSAEFMRKGLDSIAEQTFRDYELIVVCDSCTDNTAEIAKSYDSRVPELTVLEVEYGKCGLTRNKGLDIARGEWVLFMDDDDWFLHEFVFENIADVVRAKDCDIVAFGFVWKTENGNKLTPPLKENGVAWVAPWTKAWRRSFIGDHRFPAWKHSDDLGFAEEMYPLVKLGGLANFPIYYYNFLREGSIAWKLKTGELSNSDMKG